MTLQAEVRRAIRAERVVTDLAAVLGVHPGQAVLAQVAADTVRVAGAVGAQRGVVAVAARKVVPPRDAEGLLGVVAAG